MDWEINKAKGNFRHYINNEVVEIVSIRDAGRHYPEAINIVIEELENQPFIDEVKEEDKFYCE